VEVLAKVLPTRKGKAGRKFAIKESKKTSYPQNAQLSAAILPTQKITGKL
jgi:hypothetical protein